jgi:hypothetical protein
MNPFACALWGWLFYCALQPTMQGGYVVTEMLVALWERLPVCMSIR